MFEPSHLFISYRRSDAETTARSLCEALRARFGNDRVFFDTSDIPYGEDFQRVVRERIAASDVVLVVIGPSWASVRNDQGRRLEQPDDPVRFELETALAKGKRILPVRVDGAPVPPSQDWPAPLRSLSRLNMPELRMASFDIDLAELVRQLLGEERATPGLWTRLVGVAKGGPAVALVVVSLLLAATWTGFLDLFNLDTQAQRLLLKVGEPNQGEPVLMVEIDAESERRLGRVFDLSQAVNWRRDHARLIDRATAAGAQAVVFDMAFETSTEADGALAEAAQRARTATPPTRVVFGVRRNAPQGGPMLSAPLHDGAAWGSLCLTSRGSGTLWSAPLAVLRPTKDAGGELMSANTPALALSALVGEPLRAADLGRRQLHFDGPPRNPPLRFSGVERQRVDRPECPLIEVGTEQLMLRLRLSPPDYWRDPSRSLPYAQALDAVSAQDTLFKGRIVLVGLTELGRAGANPDVHPVQDGFTRRTVFGVDLQADAIRTLASARVPQLLTVDRQLLATLVAFTIAGAIAVVWFERPAWQRRLALLGLAAAWLLMAWWWARHAVLLNIAYDWMTMVLAALALRMVQVLARRFKQFRRVST